MQITINKKSDLWFLNNLEMQLKETNLRDAVDPFLWKIWEICLLTKL